MKWWDIVDMVAKFRVPYKGGGDLINWEAFTHDVSISKTSIANAFSNQLVRTDLNSY